MNSKELKQIYVKLSNRGLHFNHVCEVGVYLPETSNVINFIKEGVRATLVEADPETVVKIIEYFSGFNIRVVPVAVWDKNGKIKLSKAAASTFVSEIKTSPAIINDRYEVTEENSFEVQCQVFSEIDDGTIDLLSVDIEGSEWYVIKHLTSRPKVISIETHGKYYDNPHLDEIKKWISMNNYIVWYKDASDTVFVRDGFLKPHINDMIDTFLSKLKIKWKRFKRNFKSAKQKNNVN